MHKILVILCLAASLLTACQSSPSGEAEADIRRVMDAQAEAWNRGDIETFLEGYAKSPDLLFASRGTFSRGWDPLLERYRVAYPEGNMGVLRFDDLEIHFLDETSAWVVGSWWLAMEDSAPHGVFTLIFKQTEVGWRIIHDHSSGVDLSVED